MTSDLLRDGFCAPCVQVLECLVAAQTMAWLSISDCNVIEKLFSYTSNWLLKS